MLQKFNMLAKEKKREQALCITYPVFLEMKLLDLFFVPFLQ